MSETIRKVCACLCFLGAAAIIAPGCGNDSGSKNNGEEDCAEGETSASVDGEVGCHPTCDDGVCEAGFMCQSGICIADSTTGTNNDDNSTSNNSTPNNSTPNNSTPNNSTPNNSTPNNSTPNNSTPNNSTPNNSTPNNNTVDPTTQANCDKVADLFYGSCWDTCTLNAEVTTALDRKSTRLNSSHRC